ncbi:hypothetical protein [Herbidospora mongoliensis]|uniref:hypothetical protein n=1 Tax=Herbidospora mongoliensis TaxID=688067 RepID=UPI000AB95DEF|nr:hypothetical protein [Herbidospora mongoliensis]
MTKKTSHDERGSSREHDPIPRLKIGTVHLTAQHGDLMTKHHDLSRLGPITATSKTRS